MATEAAKHQLISQLTDPQSAVDSLLEYIAGRGICGEAAHMIAAFAFYLSLRFEVAATEIVDAVFETGMNRLFEE